MMTKRFLSLLMALAMLFGFAACGSPAGSSTTAPEPTTSAGETAEETASRIFTDDVGREVEIPADLHAIVSSGPLSQIILFAIAPDMLVGLSNKFSESARGIISDKYFDLPYFGQLYGSANLSVEELALAGPQLIVDIGEYKEGAESDLESLEEQTTIPAAFVSATLETMPQTFRTLGKLLDREEKGEELAQFCEKVYMRAMSIMEDVGEDNKVDALYITGEEGLNVLARTSYQAELIDLLVNNVAVVENPSGKGTGNEVTMEQLLIWNPEYIIFSPGSIYSIVDEKATWDEMTAISTGNYVETPEGPHNWMGSPPSVQRYLGLIWLPAVLYPEYCDYDVKADILEYYKLFYGCELTDEQYDTLTANAFLK